jgi:hypothetical protein
MRLFDNSPVRRFRIDQDTTSRLRIRVVPAEAYSDDVRRRVTALILAHGDPGFEITWEVVDEIPPAPSGKFRVTVSHVANQSSSSGAIEKSRSDG